jgi:hypothetical protein
LDFQQKVFKAFERLLVQEQHPNVKIVEVGEKKLEEVIEDARAIINSAI